MGCLYKLTSPSGKSYIGISSKGIEKRWAKHVEHAYGKRTNGVLYAALRKYGPDSFVREVLAECDDWDTLCAMEMAAIAEHATMSPLGYNLTIGGEGTRARRTAAARANIARAQQLRFSRQEEHDKLRAFGVKGNAARSDTCRAVREARTLERKTYFASAEYKALRSASVKAAHARPETKAKLVAAAKARAENPEWRKKVSASKLGKTIAPCSDERKQRIAEVRRREWADPVIRVKRLAALAIARAAKAQKVA